MSSVFDKLLKENELIKENEDIKQMTGKSHVIFKDNEGYPHWYLSISGPKKTPYEGGLFYIEIKFPKDYPNSPKSSNENANLSPKYKYAKWKYLSRLCHSLE